MKNIAAIFITECMKLRRSRIFWITILIFIVIPLMMGLMMFVAKNPEIAAKLGMIGMKASLFGNNDWSGFLALLIQSMASLGLIGFGFVTSWVFGREYSERTIKDILALPVSRSSIVVSKFLVVLIWCVLLSLIFLIVDLLIGLLLNVPGLSSHLFFQYVRDFTMTSFLTLLLCTPVAFFASYSRGLIGPIGFVILLLILAQFIGLVGLGPYFPWAIPGLYTAHSGNKGLQLEFSSYIILALTSISGFFGTIAWWRFADQH